MVLGLIVLRGLISSPFYDMENMHQKVVTIEENYHTVENVYATDVAVSHCNRNKKYVYVNSPLSVLVHVISFNSFHL